MTEITVVLVLALVFLGPKKLPELASGLGKMIREIKKMTAGVKEEIQLDENIRKPFEELREAMALPAEELKRRDEWKAEWERRQKEEEERSVEAQASGSSGEVSGDDHADLESEGLASDPSSDDGPVAAEERHETGASTASVAPAPRALAEGISSSSHRTADPALAKTTLPSASATGTDRTLAALRPDASDKTLVAPLPVAAPPPEAPVAPVRPPAPLPPSNLGLPAAPRLPTAPPRGAVAVGGRTMVGVPPAAAVSTPPSRPTPPPPPPASMAVRLPAPKVPGRTVPAPETPVRAPDEDEV